MSDPAAASATPGVSVHPRYHGLDALRAGAMALGVVLHAAAPYLRHPMQGLVWAVDGPAAGAATFPWADALFWWLHAWRVPVFFVMAGFFAAMLVERRGTQAFLKHRVERVLWPLGLACAVILPATYFAFAWGWTSTGLATWSEVFRISFGEGLRKDDVLGPAHLWFLVYLFLFCVGYAGVARVARIAGRRSDLAGWLAIAGTLAWVAVDRDVALTFHNDFVPRPMEFLYHACFFVAGVALYARRQVLDALSRRAVVALMAALVFGVGCVVVTLAHLDRPETSGVGFALMWWACCWLTILALLAAAVRWLGSPRPGVAASVRWLSDSAYWVYLTHVPVVALIHVMFNGTGVPIWVRFFLAVLVPLTATLLSYRYLVRYTLIGVWLHGRRHPPAEPQRPTETN